MSASKESQFEATKRRLSHELGRAMMMNNGTREVWDFKALLEQIEKCKGYAEQLADHEERVRQRRVEEGVPDPWRVWT